MLRAAFWMTALLLVPLGLLLYFLPGSAAQLIGISPLWLARASGGLLLAWGLFQLFAGAQPDGAKVGGLVTGNLLTVATLLPALLKLQTSLPPSLRLVLWVVVGWLGLAALLALFAAPLGGRGGEAGVR
ncbi:hypothetical protein [Deinococcus radiodurans]|uniref:Uncharacterized protein n=1 Tax=Deinococcus radiodurans (strain ATCC 13939 / DSM 20539 / JCM 16871 / CCUG 27074 / LMG 4051 / NBRC 15346 / NCIMB 9279 / VKM B-1422 / R1) TaxID=243230 RepID=Q9RVX6_DEIRA|nr:hypothetical protein [Deinococcus radiodurans]AAF10478.1 hypothetical protein DR_0895 [Deinococcus radiodurans R1 = ATCC 13939 = DSM 20539]ANC71902.1 hypothetical protein A2G07_09035 [Deinococcus radiodurans R1 = ATCC 13939 = DSM 20539]QEM70401.1 hypothetical protein DXG80_00550 [Deinococcus radiodurans]QIP29010.1 hypothetical protein HAV23_07400 [Deinococcus radiodurans]QIP32283.1 hypothetical protein HAV35_09390 [Deinococcus radiodurans]